MTKAEEWLKNHQSVYNSYDTAWHVQNFIRTVCPNFEFVADEITKEMNKLPKGYDKDRGD